MRRRIALVVGMAGLLALGVYAAAHALSDSSGIARAVAWGESDIDDRHRFPATPVAAAGEPWPLPTASAPPGLAGPVDGAPLERFLQAHATRAFLVVQDGRLVYERYFGGASRESRETSFSMAKSIVSTLVGIAVAEGAIGGVHDPVTKYLPELARRDERFSRVTLHDLLAMASGIAYSEQGMPWSDDAITYYGADLRAVALEQTEVAGPPGEWLYNNFHPLLLGLVLERATGTPVARYTEQKLWSRLGAQADASWSVDSEAHDFPKLESGFNATARDFARFGRLMLERGRGPDAQVVPADWVRRATRPTRAAGHYGYMWWLHPGGAFSARGKYGQVVAVVPEREAVVVRLGADSADVAWADLCVELAQRLPPPAKKSAHK